MTADAERDTIEARLEALEVRATSSEARVITAEDERLVEGVERLGKSTAALTAVLTQVDEQARQIANVDRKTEAVAFTIEERVATAQVERKLFLRRAYLAAALAVLCSVMAVIGGAWLTDAHIQNCLLHGPTSQAQRAFCNTTFPGHDHPTDLSLDALLAAGAAGQHKACLTNNLRTQIQIDRERKLAKADLTQNRAIHEESAKALSALLADCDRYAPLRSPHAD